MKWKMRFSRTFLFAGLVLSTVVALGVWRIGPAIIDNNAPVRAVGASPIKNVVFLMLENHSFDNFFGSYPGAYGDAKLPCQCLTFP